MRGTTRAGTARAGTARAGTARTGTARTGTAALAALALGVLLVGCAPVNAGSAAAEAFEELVNADHADWVQEFRTGSNNTLPFLGEASGSVVLRPETPPAVFAEVLDLVSSTSVRNFEASGVEANGVGVCIGDPQQSGRQQLRDALHAADASLAGDWRCPTRPDAEPLAYTGTVAGFGDDIALLRSLGTATGLELTASLSEPDGSVSGQLDELPDTAAATLLAIDGVSEVLRFELVGTALTVAIAATADPAPAQAAADAAAGRDLVAQVVLGSLDPAEQERYAELGPLLDELRALPGVEHVEASTGVVTLRTGDPAQARAIHDAAVPQLAATELGLAIEVGEGAWTMGSSRYLVPADGESRLIDDFVALLTADGVTQVALNEAGAGRDRWLSVHTDAPIMEAVQLKAVVPMGVEAQFSSAADDVSVRFETAGQLRADQIAEWRGAVDLEAFAAAWSAAP